MKKLSLNVKKLYIFIEFIVYVLIAIVLVCPIYFKVNEHNLIEKRINDVKTYIFKINSLKLKDNIYISEKLIKDDRFKSDVVIFKNKVINGEICYQGYKFIYNQYKINNIEKECDLKSEKVKKSYINYKIKNENICSERKKINLIYDNIENTKVYYNMNDKNGNKIISEKEISDKKIDIKNNGLLQVYLKNNLVSSNVLYINVNNLFDGIIQNEKPYVEKLIDNKIFISNNVSLYDKDYDGNCNLSDEVLYGYTDSLSKNFKYQESNEFKIEKNKTYYFRTKVKYSNNENYAESDILTFKNNLKSCEINIVDSEKLTKYKNVLVTAYGDGVLEYKINDNDWKKYDDKIIIDSNASKNNPIKISCRTIKDNKILNYSSKKIINIDSEKPSKPDVKLYYEGTKEIYDQNETNTNVLVKIHSKDNNNIDHYEYSHNLKDWIRIDNLENLLWKNKGNKNNTNYKFTIGWNGSWKFYVRSVDKVGNVSEPSEPFNITVKK